MSRTASTRLKTIRDDSFFVQSVKLFNSLPRNIRDLKGCSVENFKGELDKFLLKLPDAPLIPGYTATSLVGSNSVVDWCNWLKCVNRRIYSYHYQTRIKCFPFWEPELRVKNFLPLASSPYKNRILTICIIHNAFMSTKYSCIFQVINVPILC